MEANLFYVGVCETAASGIFIIANINNHSRCRCSNTTTTTITALGTLENQERLFGAHRSVYEAYRVPHRE